MSDIRKAMIVRLDIKLAEQVDIRVKESGISRNEWFTRLVTMALDNATLQKAYSGEQPEPPRVMVRKASEMAEQKKLKVIPEGRHLHHYKKIGVPVDYDKGVPQYWHECECGERKVSP